MIFGNLVSGVGSRIHGFGITLYLLDLTGEAFAVIEILYFVVISSYDESKITENIFIISFLGINFLAGMVNAKIIAPLNAAMQKYIDPNKIGKVVMIIDSFGGLLFPITALLEGYLIDYHSMYYPMYMMISAMFIIKEWHLVPKNLKN